MDDQFKRNFERAIVCQFDGKAPPNVKQDAINYCNELKQRNDIWQIALTFLMEPSTRDEVRFWCFGALSHVFNERSQILSDQDKLTIRTALLHWLVTFISENTLAYVKNKYCETLIHLFKLDYPHSWPSFFKDILSILQNNPNETMIDMYLRVLETIDSFFVARYIDRSDIEHKRAVEIKDAMRDDCIPQIVSTFYTILIAKHPSLTNSCLRTMANYIDWIDINLVTTDQFVQILFQFLSEPEFRTSACDCLSVLVNKGMNKEDKLKLITSLQLPQLLSTTKIDSESEPDFAEAISKLTNEMATQLLEIWTECVKEQNSILLNASYQLLQQLLPFIYSLFADKDDQVSSTISAFLNDYILTVKKHSNLFQTDNTMIQQFEVILNTIKNKGQFTEDFNFNPKDQDEYEAGFLEYRKELVVLFKNVGTIAPDMVKQFVKSYLTQVLSNIQGLKFSEIELALSLFYYTGEIFPNEAFKPVTKENNTQNYFGPLVALVISSNISSYPHSHIQLMYFEIISRYCNHVFIMPDEAIGSVLQSFVDERGIRHTNPQIQSRAKYLLLQFVRPLKDRLHTFVEQLFNFVKDMLVVKLPTPQDFAEKDFGEDRLFLYETIGSLVASQQVPSEVRVKILQQIFNPMNTDIEEILSKQLYTRDTPELPIYTKHLSNIVNVAGQLSKGFDNKGPVKVYLNDALEFFKFFLNYVMKIHSVLPSNRDIQVKVVFYYHRMIALLNEEVLEIIPNTLAQLFQVANSIYQIRDIVQLLNQLIQKFKEKTFNIVNEMFGPVLQKLFQLINNGNYDQTQINASEETREMADLHKMFFLFIQTVVSNGAKQVLVSDKNQFMFNSVTDALIKGCKHKSVHHVNLALSCLIHYVTAFSGQYGEQLDQYLCSNIMTEVFSIILSNEFDITEGSSYNIIKDVITLQSTFVAKCGNYFLNYMANQFLPNVIHLNNQEIQLYCSALQQINDKQKNGLEGFKQMFNQFLLTKKSSNNKQ
ncbi:hypothetical protein ABK040_013789 [Willaertia magna]